MTRGWALVGQVLAWLAALDGLARGWMPGRDWWRAFAELRQAEGVASRLAALSAVLEDPSGAVARMARFLAGELVGRASPLRPGAPPGWHAGLHMSQAGDRYMEAHRAALAALNAPRAPPALSAI